MIVKRTFGLIFYGTDDKAHEQYITVYMDSSVKKGTDRWTEDCQYVMAKAVLLLYMTGIVHDVTEIEAFGYVGTKPMQLCMKLQYTDYTDDYMLEMSRLVYDMESKRIAQYKEERENEERILDYIIDKLS